MKICCFLETWGTGGIESFLLNIFENMDRQNIEIDVVCVKKKSDLYLKRLDELNIKLHSLSDNLHKFYSNHKRFKELLTEKKYDVIHFNIYQALSMLYILDAKKCGVENRITHSHNSCLRNSFLKPFKLLIHNVSKNLFNRASTLNFACSTQAGDFMFPRNNEYIIIPNGIDLEKFKFDKEIRKNIRNKLAVSDKIIIGNVGRLCYQKNQQFLIRAFAVLKKINRNLILLLVGEGDDKKMLQKIVSDLKIEDDVIFYGISDNISGLYSAMDIFVLPSKFEGLGIVAIEAQAAGLPTICSNYVPQEVFVTELAVKFSIDNDIYDLTNLIIREINRSIKRKNISKELKDNGYDIKDVAELITNFWLKKRNIAS